MKKKTCLLSNSFTASGNSDLVVGSEEVDSTRIAARLHLRLHTQCVALPFAMPLRGCTTPAVSLPSTRRQNSQSAKVKLKGFA